MRSQQRVPPLPIAKAELAYAHILSDNKISRSPSTTLKPNSFERSGRYLSNFADCVSKFEFWQILWLSKIGYFRSKIRILFFFLNHLVPHFLSLLKCFDLDEFFYTASSREYPAVIWPDFKFSYWFDFR